MKSKIFCANIWIRRKYVVQTFWMRSKTLCKHWGFKARLILIPFGCKNNTFSQRKKKRINKMFARLQFSPLNKSCSNARYSIQFFSHMFTSDNSREKCSPKQFALIKCCQAAKLNRVLKYFVCAARLFVKTLKQYLFVYATCKNSVDTNTAYLIFYYTFSCTFSCVSIPNILETKCVHAYSFGSRPK